MGVISARLCSKPGCSRPAVATLTYDYADATAVLGPLSTYAQPNAYDMCEDHANRFNPPQDWQLIRLVTHFDPVPPSGDDLLALVDAVRQAAKTPAPSSEASQAGVPPRSSASQATESPSRSSRPRTYEARERGPFTSQDPDTSSPLDPQSPYAKRRAQFTVISDSDAPHSH